MAVPWALLGIPPYRSSPTNGAPTSSPCSKNAAAAAAPIGGATTAPQRRAQHATSAGKDYIVNADVSERHGDDRHDEGTALIVGKQHGQEGACDACLHGRCRIGGGHVQSCVCGSCNTCRAWTMSRGAERRGSRTIDALAIGARGSDGRLKGGSSMPFHSKTTATDETRRARRGRKGICTVAGSIDEEHMPLAERDGPCGAPSSGSLDR